MAQIEPKYPHHNTHNLCAIIYDQLTEVFVNENYSGLLNTKLDLNKFDSAEREKFERGEIHPIDLLEANGLNEELCIVLTKHVTMSILSDYVNFIYESLSCAMRGKMTVAYALLRKPFTDELLLFEQLLNNEEEFINRFFHDGEPSNYDPGSKKIDKLTIITNALENSKPNLFFKPDFIYDLRYKKEMLNGLNGISNHALHIVTNDKRYKTTRQNLNFVFSNKEDIEKYWENYYFFIPYLLIYSASIVDNIISKYLVEKKHQHLFDVKKMQRFVGMLLWSEWQCEDIDHKKIYEIISKNLILSCDNCDCDVVIEKSDLKLFFELRSFICPKCLKNITNLPSSQKRLNKFIELLKAIKTTS